MFFSNFSDEITLYAIGIDKKRFRIVLEVTWVESLAVVVWEEGGKSPGSWRQAKDDWVIITKK